MNASLPKLSELAPEIARAVEAPSAPDEQSATWAPVDLKSALRGEKADKPPTIGARTDGKCIGYPGKVHGLTAEYESNKTWLLCKIASDELAAGNSVLFVDNEDTETEIVSRLLALDTDPEAIQTRLIYVRPDGPLDDAAWEQIAPHLNQSVTVCALDGVNESMAAHGLDPNSTPDVAEWHRTVPKRIRDATGAAVFMTDHVVKDRESRGRHAIGSQHKQSGIDVAYVLRCVTPFGRGHDGEVRITIAKDRPGHVRGYANDAKREQAATMRLYSLADDRVRVELVPPADADSGERRYTHYMEIVSREIEAEDGQSGTAILSNVTGKREYKLKALRTLIDEGYVTTTKSGRSTLHYSAKAYRQHEDPQGDGTANEGGSDELPF